VLDPDNPGVWLLADIDATCNGCGCRLIPTAHGHGCFYTCGCADGVIEAEDLDAVVIETVTDHMEARLAQRDFGAQKVHDAWRYATAAQRAAMVTTHLAGVAVTRRNGQLDLSCLWHTARPLTPPTASAVDDEDGNDGR
jgi:hypothetical protein